MVKHTQNISPLSANPKNGQTHSKYIPFKCQPHKMVKHTQNISPLSAGPTKWSNTFKPFVGKLPTNSLSVFDHFVGLVLKGLRLKFHVQKGI